MIGIIPSGNTTYEVWGNFTSENLLEGKLYYNDDNILHYYSTIETRSNPKTGYFPVWNGKQVFSSKFSKIKKFPDDVTLTSIESLSKTINNDVAKKVLYQQRLSSQHKKLKPTIRSEDNMFTQIIKSIINELDLTIIDLIDMCEPKLEDKVIENYYNALNKIAFMRNERWDIWMNIILHMRYQLTVYRNENDHYGKKLLVYNWPADEINTGIVKYNSITEKVDPLKKVIKMLMVIESISKSTLNKVASDDYTVNNLMTTISGKKQLSAQLFDRFCSMANLLYVMEIYKGDKLIFTYK